jgi:transcriptional antiterminator RfaH
MSESKANEPRWYLIHCKPREDERALENLERQGFECYRPMRVVERWRLGRKQKVTESLFPRYLFIRLDGVNDNWSPIRSTRGVDKIVRFNDRAIPVADELIAAIRARLGTGAFETPYIKPGERVQIMGGPFSHLEAIFVASEGAERCVLLLNILHKEQELSFPMASVRKLE